DRPVHPDPFVPDQVGARFEQQEAGPDQQGGEAEEQELALKRQAVRTLARGLAPEESEGPSAYHSCASSDRGTPLERIGKFELLARLGQGGMGTVYRARDPALDRVVALKTISARTLEKSEVRQRFEREARAAARLQHPNIVTIFELGDV